MNTFYVLGNTNYRCEPWYFSHQPPLHSSDSEK